LQQGAAFIGVAERDQPWRLKIFGHGHDGGHHQFNPRIIYATIFQ
jgi:hypothetical protein